MKKFKRGDVRKDGMVFQSYVGSKEYWSSKEQLETRKKVQTKARHKQAESKIGHARLIFSGAKQRAKVIGIPFTILLDDVLTNLPDICPVLGISLSWGQRKGQNSNKDNSPSLDKFNPDLGYVSGNVYWISGLANRIKSNFTSDQHLSVANWMKQIENL